MLYLIDITWTRVQPDPDLENAGTITYAEYAGYLTAALRKAQRKFRRHYGAHRVIIGSSEQPYPARLFKDAPKVIDCGHPAPYGTCPKCGKPHGRVLMERGIPSASLTTADH